MSCGEQRPLVPGARREDWELRVSKGLPLDEVRTIRDEIRACRTIGCGSWRRPR